jgi:hypothetical protein
MFSREHQARAFAPDWGVGKEASIIWASVAGPSSCEFAGLQVWLKALPRAFMIWFDERMTGPVITTVKRLFALSGNRCAFPGCNVDIVQGKAIAGNICHIKAAQPGGPRYDPEQTSAERHDYANLILLCPTHHSVVDNDLEAYTVDRLSKMKADHERRATAVSEEQAEKAARLLLDQSVTSVNQAGGVTAHTVHQTIIVQPPSGQPGNQSDREVIRRFHQDRVSKIATAHAPVALLGGGALVLHIVPLAAASGGHASGFEQICGRPNSFVPIGANFVSDWAIRYDGSDAYLLTGSNAEGLGKRQRAYVCVFGSGRVEAVVSSLGRGQGDFLQLPELQAIVIKYARDYARTLSALGIGPPYSVLVSLIGAQGWRLLHDYIGSAFPEDRPGPRLIENQIHFGDVVFESLPADYNESARALKPILLHIANAAGLGSSPYFDANGNYTQNLDRPNRLG